MTVLVCLCDVAMKTSVDGAKIACLDFGLQKAKMHLGVSVVIDDPEKLDAIRERLAYKNNLSFLYQSQKL